MKTGYLLVIFSAFCEAAWNIALKKSTGLTDWAMNMIGILFLLGGIFSFKKSLDAIPLSITIVVWSGLSLMLTIVFDQITERQTWSRMTIFFMACSILSIVGLSYYSSVQKP